MSSKSARPHPAIERVLSLEIVRVTERAAVAYDAARKGVSFEEQAGSMTPIGRRRLTVGQERANSRAKRRRLIPPGD